MNIIIQTVARYIYKRSLEASTWRSIIVLIGSGWAVKHPDLVEAIIPITLAISGFVGSFLPDLFGKKIEVKIESRLVEREAPDTRFDRRTSLPPIELQARPETERFEFDSGFEDK